MIELSREAVKLLQYIFKFKDDLFSDYFNASALCHRKAAGHTSVNTIKPLLEELKEAKILKLSKKTFRSPRYKLDEDKAFDVVAEAEEEVYIKEYRASLEEEIKKYKKFVITTAVMGKGVNKPFLEAVKNYARRNKAMLLLLPCEDVASRGKKASPIDISPELGDFKVIFKDTYINNNLCLCAIKMSAKQIAPLSGLDRLTATRNASIIVASPKVFLKYISNMHFDIPPALMTTGAITVNDYDNDRYMSKRTSTLAENDHTYGAVIVEVENESIFHFRHVQASSYNSLTDMGVDYLPDGSIKKMKDTVLIMGDSHTGYHDKELHLATMAMANEVGATTTILHDVFHGSSISHHDYGKSVTNAIKAQEGRLGLELECNAVKNYIKNFEDRGLNVIIVESNHDDFLRKYLDDGKYVSDPMNHKFSLKLAISAIDGHNPLQYAIEDMLGYKSKNVRWLKTDESCKFYGVECAIHGSRGANGARGSLTTFEKSLGNCVTAHTHSAAILRNAMCVGTMGVMDQGYNSGLSNWTRTCCLIYSNGTKQLVNFIPNKEGDYTCQI